jgi:hypothetical protein
MTSDNPQSDASIDSELRNVPVPDGLLERLARISILTDEELDQALRDVPLPRSLLRRLRRPEDPGARRFQLQRLVLAASLLMALWLIYTMAIAGFMVAMSETPDPPPPVSAPAKTVDEKALPSPSSCGLRLQPPQSPPSEERKELAAFDPAEGPPEGRASFPRKREPSPLDQLEELLSGSGAQAPIDLLSDVNMARWKDIQASHTGFEALPELKKAANWMRRGVDVPRSPGYNVAVLSRWGVHPFVMPGLDSQLQVSQVPLAADSSSYELTRRCLEEGELPRPDLVHTEDFLAAMDYHFPRPTAAAVGLCAFGGPTPFRTDGRQLLGFGVQGRAAARTQRPPLCVTLAVDLPAGMEDGRLEMIGRAIDGFLGQFGDADRLSLVGFHEDSRVVFEDLRAANREQIARILHGLRPQRFTNLGAGLGQAYAVAQRAAKSGAAGNRVVLLTDGLAGLDRSATYRIERHLSEAATEGVHLDVIDLGQENSSGVDAALPRFAKAGGGSLHRAANANQLYCALLEILTGQPQTVAREVRLRIVFNPKAVAAYRLVGHEAREFAGLRAARLDADFLAEQSAVALYEVLLLPSQEAEIARAELTWHEPQRGDAQSAAITFRGEQFAPSWSQSPVCLQAVALAAEAAEVLRGVPEVYAAPPLVHPRPRSGQLSRVLRVANELDSRFRDNATVMDFLDMLTRAESLKPRRPGARK